MSSSSSSGQLFGRWQRVLAVGGALYVAAVVLIAVPFFQLHAVYMHSIKWPLFADFNTPEKYGFAPGKTHNIRLTTSDNVSIGAWLVQADSARPYTPESMNSSLVQNPTIIYLHGNAATRAVPFRVAQAQMFSSRLGCNVLVPDYRGFGDSAGAPSEAGLVRDARAAWDYLTKEHSIAPERIGVVGHSLGTGVTAQFAYSLEKEDVRPRAVVLMAPFSSIRVLLDTYYILGLVPLVKPLALIPGATTFFKRFLVHHFDTLSVIPKIKAPLLIVHARDDWDIPHTHSDVLSLEMLLPHLPPLPELRDPASLHPSPLKQIELSEAQWKTFREAAVHRAEKQAEIVQTQEIESFGLVERFRREEGGEVVRALTEWGGHDRVGLQEGVQDLIGEMMGLWDAGLSVGASKRGTTIEKADKVGRRLVDEI